jgi:hypothetical protein
MGRTFNFPVALPGTGDINPVDLPCPSNVTATPAAGGTLAGSAYKFRVCALGPYEQTGSSSGSPEIQAVLAAGQGTIGVAFSRVPGATGYQVYRDVDGAGWESCDTAFGPNDLSLADDGSVTWTGAATVPESATGWLIKAPTPTEPGADFIMVAGDPDDASAAVFSMFKTNGYTRIAFYDSNGVCRAATWYDAVGIEMRVRDAAGHIVLDESGVTVATVDGNDVNGMQRNGFESFCDDRGDQGLGRLFTLGVPACTRQTYFNADLDLTDACKVNVAAPRNHRMSQTFLGLADSIALAVSLPKLCHDLTEDALRFCGGFEIEFERDAASTFDIVLNNVAPDTGPTDRQIGGAATYTLDGTAGKNYVRLRALGYNNGSADVVGWLIVAAR